MTTQGPSKPHRAWRGALELELNGLPFAANIEFYGRVKKSRNESFVNLAPSGTPPIKKLIDPATNEEFEQEQIVKGYKLKGGKDAVYAHMTPESLEQIKEGQKDRVLRPHPTTGYVPLKTLALDLAIDRWAVRPDEDVPTAVQAVQIIWNGLLKSKRAIVTTASLGGGHDSVIVVYATSNGLWAAALPFEEELYPVPTFAWEKSTRMAEVFTKAMEQKENPAFDHEALQSEYRPRRRAIIEAVVNGQEIEMPEEAPMPKAEAPDLLAQLEASLEVAS
jgi:non-homologous end joining protein Ku